MEKEGLKLDRDHLSEPRFMGFEGLLGRGKSFVQTLERGPEKLSDTPGLVEGDTSLAIAFFK